MLVKDSKEDFLQFYFQESSEELTNETDLSAMVTCDCACHCDCGDPGDCGSKCY